ncbi:pseudouridine synthase [sulfur-oxidizing endosymbiont of Gigantopelta aegis]|uniref:pseudouridine synthase n=1 Tax=sulfur-oxidizing endosymbiont of Gigantopelta aegis TaxID=2794934 RepID=UPI001FEC04E1|nr:pseudouridine synthase [sulfur-oxidizing endosymbiont of Gigantopelta aegis]
MSRPFQSSNEKITIVYEDEFLLVVNKPSLLLSVPGRGEAKQDCLISRLAVKYPSILTVHRLDWETSGLTVLALDKETQRFLSRQFQERQVYKKYTAVIYGQPEQDQGEINLALRCDWDNRPLQMVDHEQGKAAQTYWQIIASPTDSRPLNNTSRVLLTPITGRSHQLRVHMLALGHPIIGDPLYAHSEALNQSERLLLHATELEFTHPQHKTQLKFQSCPPF